MRCLTPDAALGYVGSWLAQPNVEAVGPGPNHWPLLRNLLTSTGTAGNLASDAHVAALAIEYGAALYSIDNDFKRFPGADRVNPITDR